MQNVLFKYSASLLERFAKCVLKKGEDIVIQLQLIVLEKKNKSRMI